MCLSTAASRDVVVRVEDEGFGIARAEVPHIFERFFRGGGENEGKQASGAGLGLSIVKHIVEAHHGTISCESQEGRGSVFTIRLSRNGIK